MNPEHHVGATWTFDLQIIEERTGGQGGLSFHVAPTDSAHPLRNPDDMFTLEIHENDNN
ncbi:hypothetical protein DPMN_102267 [Dreissena polymorpha]|uniref:Uncharacterized protein n=1 Tax=Dreissena polymorpha TaxID=45954 RepID=A0A9D4LL41_DREPO|nr:hypothetical protein DPMN_102267 [Dreissena polymorpha]